MDLLERLHRQRKNPNKTVSKKVINKSVCYLKTHKKLFKLENDNIYVKAVYEPNALNCPLCLGSFRYDQNGFIKNCQTPHPQKIINSINKAEIPARYMNASLENFFNKDGNGPHQVQKIKKWARNYRVHNSNGLILTGGVGVGKTYILAALALYFCKRGFSVKFTDFFYLLSELRSAYSNNKNDKAILQPLIDVDVLIIDELGKGRGNNFEKATIDQLISERYKRNKTIVASTNFKISEISEKSNKQLATNTQNQSFNISGHDLDNNLIAKSEDKFDINEFSFLEDRIGPRSYSRLREMSIFYEITGKDVRQENLFLNL